MNEKFDPAAELWSIANTITGFAVAQGLAFALAVGGDLIRLQAAPCETKAGIAAISLLFALGYCVAVGRCADLASSTGQDAKIWRETTRGRRAAICSFTLLGVLALWGPSILGGSQGPVSTPGIARQLQDLPLEERQRLLRDLFTSVVNDVLGDKEALPGDR